VDVAYVETVEGDRVLVAVGGRGGSGLTVLFCFSELGDDGDAEQSLSRQLDGEWHGTFVFELNISNAEKWSALGMHVCERWLELTPWSDH